MSTKSGRALSVVLVAILLIVRPESADLELGRFDMVTPAEAQDGQLRLITFPVAGLTDYGDTYGACRDDCARTHEGVDIFAAKLTPLVAAVDGRIVSERRNAEGKPGNKIVIEDAEGWQYRYFHLNNDSPGTDDNANPQSWIMADGVRAGDTVEAGDIIGYLGDSGNAETTPAHLHFEIAPPGGSPINPTPSVTAARGRDEAVSEDVFRAPESDLDEWTDVIEDWYLDLAGRAPTDTELAEWSNRFALGLGSEADLIGDLAMSAPHREPEGVALRAYVAAFGQVPDEGALNLLASAYRSGGTAEDLADRIAASVDYQSLEDALDVDEIAEISIDGDVKQQTWHLFQVVRAFRAALDRLPDGEEIDAWTHYLEQEGLMVDVVAGALEGRGPSGPPAHAGVFSANDLGYRPGDSVRQGPIDLDPSSGGGNDATFGERRSSGGEAELDFELAVEKGEDGSDTANLTVRIPLDQLAAAEAGDAELTVELRLTQPADPDDDAEAEADVELAIRGSGSGSRSPRTGPTVDTPTTTRPTARSTTSRPTTTRAPTTRPATTKPTTSPAPSPSASTTTTEPTTTTACQTPTTTQAEQPPTTVDDSTSPTSAADGTASTTVDPCVPDSPTTTTTTTTTSTTTTTTTSLDDTTSTTATATSDTTDPGSTDGTAATSTTAAATTSAATTSSVPPTQTSASGTVSTTVGAGSGAN